MPWKATGPKTTKTPSSQSNVDFKNFISSDYSSYHISFNNVSFDTNGIDLMLRVSNDGGSSYISSGDYEYSLKKMILSTNDDKHAEGDTDIKLLGDLGAASGEVFAGDLWLHNPHNPSTKTTVNFSVMGFNQNGSLLNAHGVGQYTTAETIDAIRITVDSGNIADADSIEAYPQI